jgi:hypothetical protein
MEFKNVVCGFLTALCFLSLSSTTDAQLFRLFRPMQQQYQPQQYQPQQYQLNQQQYQQPQLQRAQLTPCQQQQLAAQQAQQYYQQQVYGNQRVRTQYAPQQQVQLNGQLQVRPQPSVAGAQRQASQRYQVVIDTRTNQRYYVPIGNAANYSVNRGQVNPVVVAPARVASLPTNSPLTPTPNLQSDIARTSFVPDEPEVKLTEPTAIEPAIELQQPNLELELPIGNEPVVEPNVTEEPKPAVEKDGERSILQKIESTNTSAPTTETPAGSLLDLDLETPKTIEPLELDAPKLEAPTLEAPK